VYTGTVHVDSAQPALGLRDRHNIIQVSIDSLCKAVLAQWTAGAQNPQDYWAWLGEAFLLIDSVCLNNFAAALNLTLTSPFQLLSEAT
jgi:hypothetical protein